MTHFLETMKDQLTCQFERSPHGLARISALGENTYTGQAAMSLARHFEENRGYDVEVRHCETSKEVWASNGIGNEGKLFAYANACSGSVEGHKKYWQRTHNDQMIRIVADVEHQISMCLCGMAGINPDEATILGSHPQGLLQCSNVGGRSTVKTTGQVAIPEDRRGSLRGIVMHEGFESTELALQAVAKRRDPTFLALGSHEAARANGLQIYIDDASNLPGENFTRMRLLQRHTKAASVLPFLPFHAIQFMLENNRGSLYRVLARVAEEGVNVVSIYSNPMTDQISRGQFLFELQATRGANLVALEKALKSNPDLHNTLNWHSWADRVESKTTLPVRQYPKIEWKELHKKVTESYGAYKLMVILPNNIGSLSRTIQVIQEKHGNILEFNALSIGHKKQAFEMLITFEQPMQMRKVLDVLASINELLAIDLEKK